MNLGKLFVTTTLSLLSLNAFGARISGNIHEAEYNRPEDNKGRAGFVKFRRLSIDTPNLGVTLSNGRVFDSSIRLNRRYISFSGSNHSFGFSFSDEKTLEFADFFHVAGTSFDIRSRSLEISSDSIRYGKNTISASFYNFTATCNAYPSKSFSDTENIYYGCVHQMSIEGKDGTTASLEASSNIDFIGKMDIKTDIIDGQITENRIEARLNNSFVSINDITVAQLPQGLNISCDKNPEILGSDYNKIINECVDGAQVEIPQLELSGVITKNDQPLFTADGIINNVVMSTKNNLSLELKNSNVSLNGIRTAFNEASLLCQKNSINQMPLDSVDINGKLSAMMEDCASESQVNLKNFRARTNFSEVNDANSELSIYTPETFVTLNNPKINLLTNDLTASYGDIVTRITNLNLSCNKSLEFKLDLNSFDRSCSSNLLATPKEGERFSHLSISIPNDEGSYEIRAQVKETKIQNSKLTSDIGRMKVTIAPEKDIYLDQVKSECLNRQDPLLTNYQAALDRCLTDLKLERTQLIYMNEVDNYRYYTDIRNFNLDNDRLIANVYGVQMKGKKNSDTSITIKDLNVNCFRHATHNPLGYQEQIDFCLEDADVTIGKIILPSKRKDARGLYRYYQMMVDSEKMEVTNPIDLVSSVEPKVKNIRIRAQDQNLTLTLKAKVAGIWINVRIVGRVVGHDKENKTITLRRTDSSIAPFLLKAGIKMAVPESLVKVDGDRFIVKYY